MELHHFLTFASDAELIGLWGIGFAVLAIVATLAETRRNRRGVLERVGWMPWRAIFLASAMISAGFLALALKGLATP